MTKFFATAHANGLISHELRGSNLAEARRELQAACGTTDESGVTIARSWIDSVETDLEDELEINCSDLEYEDAIALALEHGARRVVIADSDDQWEIVAVDE